MARLKLYECPYCERHFWFDLALGREPEICPICANSGEAPPEEPQPLKEGFGAPYLSSPKARLVDQHYRQLEEGSAHRADVAREMGLDSAAADAIKITDIKDNLQYGEVAAVEPNNAVSQNIAAIGGGKDLMQTSNTILSAVPAIRSGAAEGPEPFAGMKALSMLKQRHAGAGGVITDTPAAEIGARERLIAQAQAAAQRRRR